MPTSSRARRRRCAPSASGCRPCSAPCPGVEPFPSEANMILVRVADGAAAFRGMKERGVLVKNVAGLHPLLAELPAPHGRHAGGECTDDRRPARQPAMNAPLPTTAAARRATVQRDTKETKIRVARRPRRQRHGQARHRHRLLRPHARADRPPRPDRPRDRGPGRPAHRRPPHGRGRRHHPRPGGRPGGRRQARPGPLRPRLRAARRGAVAGGDRFLRPARADDERAVQVAG